MRRAEQAELNISREHRLHCPPGNDVNELRLEIVLTENTLFLGNPQRHSVAADRTISENQFRGRLSAMRSAQPNAIRKNHRQPLMLHAFLCSSYRLERFKRFERPERVT